MAPTTRSPNIVCVIEDQTPLESIDRFRFGSMRFELLLRCTTNRDALSDQSGDYQSCAVAVALPPCAAGVIIAALFQEYSSAFSLYPCYIPPTTVHLVTYYFLPNH